MEEFRKTYKEKHPNNKSVAAVGKAGGDKWKSMSEAEKAPFVSRAEKRKTEYNKNIEAYNKRIVLFFPLIAICLLHDCFISIFCFFCSHRAII
ncbi:HMG1/2-like protein [Camellia sinensis]|uniref:HMG1/2-like protein n=1 Tax=Camellia sinensis TaxID=4442 RepID=UPI0010368DD4|nr:HMG1/2-like protein [Camellia sinensis]